jgi:hypothetical protein
MGAVLVAGQGCAHVPTTPPDDDRRVAERAAVMRGIAMRLQCRYQVELWPQMLTFDYAG